MMNERKSHKAEVDDIITSIEEDTGVNINCLANRAIILSKIKEHVREKDDKLKELENQKRSIVSKILQEKQLMEKKKDEIAKQSKMVKKVIRKTSTKSMKLDLKDLQDLDDTSVQVELSSTPDMTENANKSSSSNITGLKRRVSNKIRRKKSKKSMVTKSDVNVKKGNTSEESCREFLKHISKVEKNKDLSKEPLYDKNVQDKDNFCLRDWKEIFAAKPENFNFYDYINGNVYRKIVKLTNKSTKTVSCTFHSIYYPDFLHMHSDLISVDFKNQAKLYPGLSFQFTITFKPTNLETDFRVELIFMANINGYMAFVPVPVQGILSDSLVEVNPTSIDFGKKPVWEVTDNSKKYRKEIIVTCTGRRPIEMFVKKSEVITDKCNLNKISVLSVKSRKSSLSRSPERFESESNICASSSELVATEDLSKSSLCVNSVLEECFNFAVDAFYFEKRHVVIQPNVPNKIYIWFKNATYLGFHQSQLDFEFFKRSNKATDQTSLTFFTKKTITLFSETYDLPTVIAPLTLDLSDAKHKQGAIHSFFTIHNTHKTLSTYIEVIMPVLEKHMLCITPDKLYIQPLKMQKFKITYVMKENAKHSLLNDSVVNIGVKIFVRIKNDKYSTAPPYQYMQIYAPYNV